MKHKNKKHLYSVQLIISCLIFVSCLSTKPDVPKIEISNKVNLGEIVLSPDKNDTIRFEVPYKNLAEEFLTIGMVSTSCECVKDGGGNVGVPVRPKALSKIKMMFMPTRQDLGYIERTIFVDFRGYNTSYILTVAAKVSYATSKK